MTSSRLPGKVLAPIAGEPMLERVVRRTLRARAVDAVVIATTTEPIDDAIVDVCRDRGRSIFRGSRDDVLDRYHGAAAAYHADVVVRITSDCPLVDPEIVDRTIQEFTSASADYASTGLPPAPFPCGLDVEVIARAALERAWKEDRDPAWREHVTPYLYQHPERFRLRAVAADRDYSHLRLTVDTADDLRLVEKIFAHFGHDHFSWRDATALLEQHPAWLEINRHVRQRAVPDRRV